MLNSSPLIQGYAGLSIHSLRRYPRFSADAGLSFESSQLTWESQYVGSSIKVTGTEEMSHSFISLPFLINYSLFKTRKKDFFSSGWVQDTAFLFPTRILQFRKSSSPIRIGSFWRKEVLPLSGVEAFFYQAQAGFLVNLPRRERLLFPSYLGNWGIIMW
ncbi:hypothetical protein [Algoriphagus boritolerans]|uniref:hypothetical protein n=1 Tax=Algoriphagus boritolerans TaxID=308111 RepID=UPI000A7919CF